MSVKYGFTEEQEKSIAYGQIVGLESILTTLIQNSYIRKDVYLSTHMDIIDRMVHDVIIIFLLRWRKNEPMQK